MKTQNTSYKLPHTAAFYAVVDKATGEKYFGSSNNLMIRWKTHRKNRTEANQLLERPTSQLVWVECETVDMARAMERAAWFAWQDTPMLNTQAPSGYLEKPCMTAAEAKEKKKQRSVGWNQLNPERHRKHKADYRARKGL